MPHFFIESKNVDDRLITIIDKDTYQHLTLSMRIKTGEKIKFIDENQIQYETVVSDIDKRKIKAEITDKYPSKRKLNYKIDLAQSILKSDAQLSSIKKATELGVHKIYSTITENTQLKKNIIESKLEKWQKIAYESAKQCERADIPQVELAMDIKALIDQYENVVVYAEKYADTELKEIINKFKVVSNKNLLVVIGPEGGFTESEFEYFKSKKLPLVSLGNLILRADTAVAAGLDRIIYELSR